MPHTAWHSHLTTVLAVSAPAKWQQKKCSRFFTHQEIEQPIYARMRGLSNYYMTPRRLVFSLRRRATNKRSRSVTLEREPAAEKGTSVWIDWHIAPGEA